MTTDDQWWQTEENDSVATKRELWEPIAERVGGFDLDPAAGCEPTPIADERYTEADDGLTQPWYGTVWLNPPFSEKEVWFRRLVAQYEQGNINRAVALTNAGTDTEWFQNYVSTAELLVFLDGRDWYTQRGTENFASLIAVWNPTPELREWLHTMGTVAEPQPDPKQQKLL